MKILLSIVVLLVAFFYITNEPDFGENMPSVSWLPKEATNVSFSKNWGWDAYEFKISEQGFLKWANQKGYDVKLISDINDSRTPSLERYNMSTENDFNKTRVVIKDGYFYHYDSPSGNGACRCIGYDRKTKKAYYFGATH